MVISQIIFYVVKEYYIANFFSIKILKFIFLIHIYKLIIQTVESAKNFMFKNQFFYLDNL